MEAQAMRGAGPGTPHVPHHRAVRPNPPADARRAGANTRPNDASATRDAGHGGRAPAFAAVNRPAYGSHVGHLQPVPAAPAGDAVRVLAREPELALPGGVRGAVRLRPLRAGALLVAAAALGHQALPHGRDDLAGVAGVEERATG